MRCFIGVPLPENVRTVLTNAQKCFRKVDARMNVVKNQNLHVTLNFLGSVDDLSKINEALSQVKFSPFDASLNGISFFPKKGYIRVIHSPIKQGKEELIDLYGKICVALGVNIDQFTPHVTLARVKFVKSTNTLTRACFNEKFEVKFKVNSFNLYSSSLNRDSPTYKVLKVFK